MQHVLILGAYGGIAQQATRLLLQADIRLTLYLRNAWRLAGAVPEGGGIVDADVLDTPRLVEAMLGIDALYANLGGEMGELAQALVAARALAGGGF